MCARLINPVEALEDFLRVLCRYPWTAIFYFNLCFVGRRLDTDFYTATGGRVFHCIVDEIDQHLTQDEQVGGDGDGWISLNSDGLLFLFGQDFKKGRGLSRQI